MVGHFVVETNETRPVNTCKAFCFALPPFFMIIGCRVLIWNEGNLVTQRRALDEGLKNILDVNIDKLDPTNRGKLIHFIGPTTIPTTQEGGVSAVDPMFGAIVPEDSPLKLKRTVEMLQWTESENENTDGHSYKKEWRNYVIDSKHFHKTYGHENPTTDMRFYSNKAVANPINVGAYTLSDPVLAEMEYGNWYKTVKSVSLSVDSINDESIKKDATVHGNYFYFSAYGSHSYNNVGDTRVGFEEIPSQTISVVAKQLADDSLDAYPKGWILLVESGSHNASEMFQHAQAQLTSQTWFFRGFGFVVVLLSCLCLVQPITAIVSGLPGVCKCIVFTCTDCIPIFAALVVSIVVISVAWLVYRAIFLAVPLSVCAVVGIFFCQNPSKQGQLFVTFPSTPTGEEIPMAKAVPYYTDGEDDHHGLMPHSA